MPATEKEAVYYLGCDLGGTNMRAAVVNVETGAVSHFVKKPTRAHEPPESIIARMAGLFEAAIAASGIPAAAIHGAGVGVPGRVDYETGETRFLPNFHGNWPDVPLAQRLKELTGLPTHLINDVRSITLGEWQFGAGKGVDTLACFAIGTGIGGGLVIKNRLHLGLLGSAGELGHLIIDSSQDAPMCGCGARGCVEAYASGPQIAARGVRAVIQGRTTLIGEMSNHDLNRINPVLIFRAAQRGDPVALEIYQEAGYHLGIAVASLVVALAPKMVIFGGGVSAAGEVLLAPVRRALAERVHMLPPGKVKLVQALLGDKAGIAGAAGWAYLRTEKGYDISSEVKEL